MSEKKSKKKIKKNSHSTLNFFSETKTFLDSPYIEDYVSPKKFGSFKKKFEKKKLAIAPKNFIIGTNL